MAKFEALETIERIAEETDWSEESQLVLACSFIDLNELNEEWREWLEEQAGGKGVLALSEDDEDDGGDLDGGEE